MPKQLEKVHENPWQHGQDEDEEHEDDEEDGEFGFELEGDEPKLAVLRRLITGGVV